MDDHLRASTHSPHSNQSDSKVAGRKTAKDKSLEFSLKIDDYRPQFLSNEVYDRVCYERQKARGIATNTKQIRKCIGVVRASWFNQNNLLSSFSYATGFVVSSRVIMVSANSFYSKHHKRFADRLDFLPHVCEGVAWDFMLQMRTIINLRIGHNLFMIKNNIIQGNSLRYEIDFSTPRKQIICLIVLPQLRRFEYEEYITIGEIPDMEPSTPLPLTIIGYPSNNYMTCIDFSQANILRSEVNCYLDSIGETVENVPELGQTVYRPNRTEAVFEVINHTSRAREGMKGAPILTVNSSGKFYAIGMHSHIAQSSAYSSGVYFDRKVLRAIQEIELKIQTQLSIPKQINYCFFPRKMKISKIEEVSEPEDSTHEPAQEQVKLGWGSPLEALSEGQDDDLIKQPLQSEKQESCCSEMSEMEGIQEMMDYFTVSMPHTDSKSSDE